MSVQRGSINKRDGDEPTETSVLLHRSDEDEDKGKALEQGSASITSSYINLVNTIVGAGLLSIPFAFRSAGVILGLVFLASIFALSSLSFDVLARSAHHTNKFTYKEIALKTWGRPLAWLGEIAIFLYTVSNTIARPIIIADFVGSVICNFIGNDSFVTRKWFLIICLQSLLLPLCLLRKIDFLKITSFFSLLCVLFAAIVIAIRFGTYPKHFAQVRLWPKGVDMFISFGILVLAFCAHYNAPAMYLELKDRSPRKWRRVVYSSTLSCFFLYAFVGLLGYFTFLQDTEGDILNDYHPNDGLVIAARVALSLALVLSTPLVMFAARRSALTMVAPNKPFSWLLWTLLTVFLLAFVGVIGWLVPNIDIVFGFSGSVLGTLFVFILPGLFYYKITPDRSRKDVAISFLLVAGGAVLLTLGTTGAAVKLVQQLNTTKIPGNCTII